MNVVWGLLKVAGMGFVKSRWYGVLKRVWGVEAGMGFKVTTLAWALLSKSVAWALSQNQWYGLFE